ncbi:MAG TPA: RidA family protein [Planctomycetaceae bacterium]|nr:RidA family protein [Planctomycetaceae bacterium]
MANKGDERQGGVEVRLDRLGLSLPPPAAPKGLYRPLVIVGDLAFTSGHLPVAEDGSLVRGRLGEDLDQAAGQEAARRAGLAILATLRAELGTLDRVRRVVKVLGVVNSATHFDQQPAVINGCSQLFADVFGPEAGIGARSAIGAPSLPLGAAVEVEAIFQIETG